MGSTRLFWGVSMAIAGVLAVCNVARADDNGPQVALREKLKVASTYSEKRYRFVGWMRLREAMDEARRLLERTGATPSELQTALARVQSCIGALEERPLLPDSSPRIALSASLFATARRGTVNNVALLWGTAMPCDLFELYRASGKVGEAGVYTKIYSGRGSSFHDYGLKSGSYTYKLVAHSPTGSLTSHIAQIATTALPMRLEECSNQTGAGVDLLWEPLKVGKTYYRFDGKRDGKTMRYIVQTSSDNKIWKDGPVVLDTSSHPDLDDFKLEASDIFYDKRHNRIVWWGHWERSGSSYGDGRAFVATAKPGERFQVHRIFNPLGVQVRDMSVFIDNDQKGYLVAASNVAGQGANATLTIFSLNADYTDVTGIVNKAMEEEYREAPHIVRLGGFYYLFFSQAAGWYPSRAGYVTTSTLDGRWSEARYIGNSSTFSAQSGAILELGHGTPTVPVLMANRWIRGEGTSANAVVPLHCVDGFALGDYAPTLLLDRDRARVFPLHSGELLSQDRPATASIVGNKDRDVSRAFDGDYATSFQSDDKTWPFQVTTDLGSLCAVRNVQISWHLHKGSEAYYKYVIEGSVEGDKWQVLLDRTDDRDSRVSKTYGFTSDLLPSAPKVRYLRVTVQRAVLHNNPNNWYPPTLYEVKVFGERVSP